jgi:hypothetical protein
VHLAAVPAEPDRRSAEQPADAAEPAAVAPSNYTTRGVMWSCGCELTNTDLSDVRWQNMRWRQCPAHAATTRALDAARQIAERVL